MKKEEQGYILLETLIVGVILLAMVAGMRLYRQAVRVEDFDSMRTAGIFLAREEFSWLEWQAEQTGLIAGHVEWLGDEKALMMATGRGRFAVTADVTPLADNAWHVLVTVVWPGDTKQETMQFTRVLCRQGNRERGYGG
ncbi:hypothetical protein SAMN02910356_00892 [Selenomonas sp. GACV-9]|uniref:hypothetical protein n=1 Tax=Selenomonas sp. GACV-9 TaxID=3158782 RepID=UPI0008EE3119|nr:hypothetical protein SAMN02910356_00892 [Selenomonas ruminantium]